MRLPSVSNSNRVGGLTLSNNLEGLGESGSIVFIGELLEGPASIPGRVEFKGVVMFLIAIVVRSKKCYYV